MCKLHRHRHLRCQLVAQLKAAKLTVIPPADFCLNTTSGGLQFRRIPTASNSISNILFCSAVFVASTIRSGSVTSMRRSAYSSIQSSLLFWRPRQLVFLAHDLSSAFHTTTNVPFAASCTIPGKSSNCIRAPSYSSTPGIAFSISSLLSEKKRTVKVVNSYAPTLDSVFVVLDNRVDFPTDGNPIRQTRASTH